MVLSICDGFSLDIGYLYGQPWNVQPSDMKAVEAKLEKAASVMASIRASGDCPGEKEKVLFPKLPYVLEDKVLISKSEIKAMKTLAQFSQRHADAVISVGIGGSYLGNQVLFDVACGSYWNESKRKERGDWPMCFFAGQTADPEALGGLLSYLKQRAKRKKSFTVLVLVISKSGTTIEPAGALSVLERELPKFCRARFVAITDPQKGKLHDLCQEKGWTRFVVPEGIGGRFSVFSQVGIVFASLFGMDVKQFLAGARAVEESCRSADWRENPALALAGMKYISTETYGICAEVTMPYASRLRSLAWWYAQLLGESLGKKQNIHGDNVFAGRIPVSAVGSTDMHSLTQEQQEGKRNKLLQFIQVDEPAVDLDFALEEGGRLCTVPMSHVLKAALLSNAKSLANEERMSCTLTIREINLYYVGALMYFFFLTISYEGAMADIDAYNQPGVEGYKKILHKDLAAYGAL